MVAIDMRADLTGLQRALFTFHADQVPFAASLALNSLALGVMVAEQDEVKKTFDSPTPFTENAFFVQRARKTSLVAVVKAKDIQAAYLEPYVRGGPRSLGGKKGMLVPRDIRTNKYGNLPRGALQAALAKPDTFVGKITFKKTGETVSGIWQRGVGNGKGAPVKAGERKNGGRGTKGNNQNVVGGVRTTLKLLLQFEDTTAAPKHLAFYERARTYVKANASKAFSAGMHQAMTTKRK